MACRRAWKYLVGIPHQGHFSASGFLPDAQYYRLDFVAAFPAEG
jgi:hypothetical protein